MQTQSQRPPKRWVVTQPESISPRAALIIALVVLFALRSLIPFGRVVLYPFTLLATWVHEMGHGIVALTLGGSFHSLDIFANASGLAHCGVAAGWRDALVCMGGLLGPPVVGGTILMVSRTPQRARVLLLALGIAMLVSLAIWVRSPTGIVLVPTLAALIIWVATTRSAETMMSFSSFVGVALASDTITRADYLFTSHAEVNGRSLPSDISRVAAGLGGATFLWGLALCAFSLLVLFAGVSSAWTPKATTSRTPRARTRVR